MVPVLTSFPLDRTTLRLRTLCFIVPYLTAFVPEAHVFTIPPVYKERKLKKVVDVNIKGRRRGKGGEDSE